MADSSGDDFVQFRDAHLVVGCEQDSFLAIARRHLTPYAADGTEIDWDVPLLTIRFKQSDLEALRHLIRAEKGR